MFVFYVLLSVWIFAEYNSSSYLDNAENKRKIQAILDRWRQMPRQTRFNNKMDVKAKQTSLSYRTVPEDSSRQALTNGLPTNIQTETPEFAMHNQYWLVNGNDGIIIEIKMKSIEKTLNWYWENIDNNWNPNGSMMKKIENLWLNNNWFVSQNPQ